MFSFRPVNLPPHVLLTSTTVIGLGLYISLFRTSPLKPLTGRDVLVPAPSTSRIADTNALLGVVACALQLPYFLSSYMPIEKKPVAARHCADSTVCHHCFRCECPLARAPHE